ncbi:FkbM family methyltransferase [Runella aurantiaca]|uniref:FkbM family methyltransferase n=1 Tax=Runella aurantiaca TaxID=2282308 RepID=A0A369I600_9BACT|nr:FkbM family methyltransferase [Runella aurantiaca]RDB04330.1 FkbM family methyltransferase [Runella aurantiaca]
MILENLEFKILKKLSLLNFFNVSKRISYARHKINVPVVGGLGYPNLYLKPNWLYLLVNELFVSDGQTFVDVGANIGQTLLSVKTAEKQINYIGFEPAISCCYYLKELVRVNNLKNCHIYNFALSDKLGQIFLERNNDADPTASIIEELRPQFFKLKEPIISLNLDILELDAPINCIKIDIEGAELEALNGMEKLIRKNRPYIICEVLDSFSDEVFEFTQKRAAEVCSFLKALDYSIIQLVQDETTERIISFHEIDTITLIQWNKKSLQLNDYIFFPSINTEMVTSILTKLIK